MSNDRFSPPKPLAVAAALVALEGGALLVLAVLALLDRTAGTFTIGVTVAVFFLGCSGALLLCAAGAVRSAPWSRSPLVLAQLMALGLAWNFRGEETRLVAVLLAVTAGAVLVGVLHPASTEALTDDATDDPVGGSR